MAAVAAIALFWQPGAVRGAITLFAPLTSQDGITGAAQDTTQWPLGYFTDATIELTAGVGGAGGNRRSRNLVLGFELPTLALGQTITDAVFSITVASSSGSLQNVALFGLNTDDPESLGLSLFNIGATDPDHELITSAFTTSAAAAGSIPSADVFSFIESLYTGNVPNQSEVFFRLNQTVDTGFNISRATFSSLSAQLQLTVIPEPRAAMLGIMGLLALVARRRRPSE